MTRIALVVLDTLRNDFFEQHFDWLPGTRYTNAWSPSHWTVPVHASLFTGIHPSEHGVHAKNQSFDIESDVLAEKLAKMGYMTRAYSSNPYISPSFDFDRGFRDFHGNTRVQTLLDNIFDWDSFLTNHQDAGPLRYFRALHGCLTSENATIPSLKQGLLLKMRGEGWIEPEDSGGKEAHRWLKSHSLRDDEFIYVNLMEAHAPYDEIPNSFQTDSNYALPNEIGLQQTFERTANNKEIRQAYEDAVVYLSHIYRDIFKLLSQKMDYVITIGDHGELLGEHGLWGHEYGLYSELTNVPLVISDGSDKIEYRDELVGLINLYQTILDLAGAPGHSRETALLIERNSKEILMEGHGLPRNRTEKLKDLGFSVNEYDKPFRGIVAAPSTLAHESVDGWVCDNSDDNDLQKRLNVLVEDLEERSVQRSVNEIDKRTLQQLQDMGYA